MNTNACAIFRPMVLAVVACAFLGMANIGWSTPDPPPICPETGPHNQLTYCVPGGAWISGGMLIGTNINVFVGQQIYPPSLLTPPVFMDGVQSNVVFYDCYVPYHLCDGETFGGVISYGNYSLFFVPLIPGSIDTPGTNTYTAKVVAYPNLPFGSVCPVIVSWQTCATAVTDTLATVTITVWQTGDSDYDGICDRGEGDDGTDPYNPSSVQDTLLGYWRFDNTNYWAGEDKQVPITFTNIVGTPSFSGTAVVVDNANGAVLQYRDVESNACTANLNLRRGTVELWFKADWNSTTTNNGVGPQGDGRLIEVGAKGGSGGWWALGVGAAGTNLYFGTQTNLSSTLTTNLSATINWVSNQWHQIVLTYSTNNSSLYVDGVPVVTTGLGVACYSGPTVRAQGFTVGGNASGANQARGAFDELQTFNYPLDAGSIAGQYQEIINSPGYDRDGDGVPNGNDADPNDPNIGALPFAIRISQPASGSVIY